MHVLCIFICKQKPNGLCTNDLSHTYQQTKKLADFQNDIYDACKPVIKNVLQLSGHKQITQTYYIMPYIATQIKYKQCYKTYKYVNMYNEIIL